MIKEDLTIIKGDTFIKSLYFKSEVTGLPVDITGSTVIFTAKIDKTDPDVDAVIQVKKSVHDDPTQGFTILELEPDDTDVTAQLYCYDIQFTTASGRVYTLQYGELEIIEDTTKDRT